MRSRSSTSTSWVNASKSNAWRACAVRRSAEAASVRSPSRAAARWITPKPLTPCAGRRGAANAWPPRSRSASSATSPVATDGSGSTTTRSTPGSSSASRRSRGPAPRSGTRPTRNPRPGSAPASRSLDRARAGPREEPDVQRPRRVLEQRRDQHRGGAAAALAQRRRAVDRVAGRRVGGRRTATARGRRARRDGHRRERREPVALLGGGDVGRRQLAPERVHLVLRAAGQDRAWTCSSLSRSPSRIAPNAASSRSISPSKRMSDRFVGRNSTSTPIDRPAGSSAAAR